MYEYLRYHTRAPHRWSQKMRTELERICEVVTIDEATTHNIRDPKDNHVLEAAIAGKCDYIITGDKDLLEVGSYYGIEIVRPAAFAGIVAKEEVNIEQPPGI